MVGRPRRQARTMCDFAQSRCRSLAGSLPRAWSDDYFALCTETTSKLTAALSSSNIRTLATVMVNFNEMGEKDRALRIASIVSEAECAGYYLVIVSDIEPRRELTGEEQLAGVMKLIY